MRFACHTRPVTSDISYMFSYPCRKRTEVATAYILTMIMAVLIGTAFLDIGTSQLSVAKRGPVLFFCAVSFVCLKLSSEVFA